MPVRKGFPLGVSGLTDIINSPLHATAAGLVVYGSRRVARRGARGGGGWRGRSTKKIKKWFSEFF
jgi:cell division protein FtsA